MTEYAAKLLSLFLRCTMFSLIGGAVFTVMSHSAPAFLPFLVAAGAGAGWQLTRPLGFAVVGTNSLLPNILIFTVRVGAAVCIGWAILVPYSVYLIIRSIRG